MSENECSICIEPITDSQETKTTACGHTFHKDCYRSWILQNTSCPVCRHEDSDDDDIWDMRYDQAHKDFHKYKYSASDICEALGLDEYSDGFDIIYPLVNIIEERRTSDRLSNELDRLEKNRRKMAMGWDLIFKEAKWKWSGYCFQRQEESQEESEISYGRWKKENGKWIYTLTCDCCNPFI